MPKRNDAEIDALFADVLDGGGMQTNSDPWQTDDGYHVDPSIDPASVPNPIGRMDGAHGRICAAAWFSLTGEDELPDWFDNTTVLSEIARKAGVDAAAVRSALDLARDGLMGLERLGGFLGGVCIVPGCECAARSSDALARASVANQFESAIEQIRDLFDLSEADVDGLRRNLQALSRPPIPRVVLSGPRFLFDEMIAWQRDSFERGGRDEVVYSNDFRDRWRSYIDGPDIGSLNWSSSPGTYHAVVDLRGDRLMLQGIDGYDAFASEELPPSGYFPTMGES